MSQSGNTYYVGLATTFHDPAIAIVNPQGEVVFAEAAERYYQNKRAVGCQPDNTIWASHVIAEYTDPHAQFVVAGTWSSQMHRLMKMMSFFGLLNPYKIHRQLERVNMYCETKHDAFWTMLMQLNALNAAGAGFGMALRSRFGNNKIRYVNFPHHLTHAVAACQFSPFDRAACMVVDNSGEKGAITYYNYENGDLNTIQELKRPASLGTLYSSVTDYCGFEAAKGEEWKVMGLAPYGSRINDVYQALKNVLEINGINLKYRSKTAFQSLVDALESARRPEERPVIEAADLSHTIQSVYEESMTEILNSFHELGHSDNLVISGGCGLNSAYNGKILQQTPFKQLYVPSAPGDDGNAIGAALLAYQQDQPKSSRKPNCRVHTPYLGSRLSQTSLKRLVEYDGFRKIRHIPETIYQEAAALLAEGKLLGWAQGRAEFGPRALGNRSILADPRSAAMKDTINARVKFREEFRPFAPSILAEFGPEYFEDYQESPYMERTLRFKDKVKDKVPAVVHVNQTGRLQTVKPEWNEPFYRLIKAFYDLTGVPVLLNTSFNIMGKPIIHSVEDALGVFLTTGLDAIALEGYLIEK